MKGANTRDLQQGIVVITHRAMWIKPIADRNNQGVLELTYFAHSTSKDNEARIRSGWSDVPLSPKGIEQTQSLCRQCAAISFDAIFCSDLQRAAETAKIAFPGRAVVHDPRLREMNYGMLNGCAAKAFSGDPLECIHTPYNTGENCLDVERRIRAFLNERISTLPSGSIAIISHKYPQLALEVICNNATWEQAILNDWREEGNWQPRWRYRIDA